MYKICVKSLKKNRVELILNNKNLDKTYRMEFKFQYVVISVIPNIIRLYKIRNFNSTIYVCKDCFFQNNILYGKIKLLTPKFNINIPK